MLLIADPDAESAKLSDRIRCAAADPGLEILETTIAAGVTVS
jgi:hypothetical protein